MSYAKPFGNLNSEIPKMSHGYCDTPDAVNNDVQDRAAEGSSYHPTPCPLAEPMGWSGNKLLPGAGGIQEVAQTNKHGSSAKSPSGRVVSGRLL